MKLSREAKTGIVTIVVIAIAIWGFNFLKGKNIFKSTSTYYVVYQDVEGLIESGYVYYRGYKIGNITGLEFNKANRNSFIVEFIVNKDIKIPLNSVVTATQSSIIASIKDLEISFSDENSFHESGDTLLAGYDLGMMGMIDPIKDDLEEIVESLKKTISAINNTFDEKTQKDLKSTISSLNRSLVSLGYMLSPNGTLGKTMKNVEAITSNIKDKNEEIGKSIDHMANVTAALDSSDLKSIIQSLDSTLLATKDVMNKINDGEGTAGLLINDSLLYINLASTTASLDSLLVDLKEHPKRYVHLSVFGGKDK